MGSRAKFSYYIIAPRACHACRENASNVANTKGQKSRSQQPNCCLQRDDRRRSKDLQHTATKLYLLLPAVTAQLCRKCTKKNVPRKRNRWGRSGPTVLPSKFFLFPFSTLLLHRKCFIVSSYTWSCASCSLPRL